MVTQALFRPRNAATKDAVPRMAYARCQDENGESDSSKDARNPNPQKAANPTASTDAVTRANTDQRDNAMAAKNDTAITPTTMNGTKVME